MASNRSTVILVVAGLVSIPLFLLLILYLQVATPPYFVQMGKYYFGGSSLFSYSGLYECLPHGNPYCTPEQVGVLSTIGSDPNPTSWWPIRIELIKLGGV